MAPAQLELFKFTLCPSPLSSPSPPPPPSPPRLTLNQRSHRRLCARRHHAPLRRPRLVRALGRPPPRRLPQGGHQAGPSPLSLSLLAIAPCPPQLTLSPSHAGRASTRHGRAQGRARTPQGRAPRPQGPEGLGRSHRHHARRRRRPAAHLSAAHSRGGAARGGGARDEGGSAWRRRRVSVVPLAAVSLPHHFATCSRAREKDARVKNDMLDAEK